MNAEELLRRYADGERDFAEVDLSGVDLTRQISLISVSPMPI